RLSELFAPEQHRRSSVRIQHQRRELSGTQELIGRPRPGERFWRSHLDVDFVLYGAPGALNAGCRLRVGAGAGTALRGLGSAPIQGLYARAPPHLADRGADRLAGWRLLRAPGQRQWTFRALLILRRSVRNRSGTRLLNAAGRSG